MKRIIIIFTLITEICFGQIPQWITLNSTNSSLPSNLVASIAIDAANNKWFGTVYGGLAKFDGALWSVFTMSNSGLTTHNVQCIAIDPNDNKWIGSGWSEPISKFSNSSWTVYDSASTNNIIPKNCNRTYDILAANGNIYIGTAFCGLKVFDGLIWNDLSSNLSGPFIYDLERDKMGNIWIGHWNNGITKFDGITWTNFNTSNSPLPSNDITSIAFESNGTMWATSRYNGLVKYDGSTWTVYTTTNSALPSNILNTIKIDANNVKWIATGNKSSSGGSGLIKFVSPTNISVFNTTNSGIPSNETISLAIDKFNNVWVGTQNHGVGVLNESGVVSVGSLPNSEMAISYGPNPFNEKITFVAMQKDNFMVILRDIHGQKVKSCSSIDGELVIKKEGLLSGVYFFTIIRVNKPATTGKILIE